MNIRISALDTLFFRDGKPFSMGEDSWADGVFPPYPSVLYGALRTWYIANHAEGATESIIGESGQISIKGIHYRLPSELQLPMPLDLVEPKLKEESQQNEEKRNKAYQVIKLKLSEKSGTISTSLTSAGNLFPSLLMPTGQIEVESLEDGLISHTAFKQYLEGTLDEVKIQRVKDIAPSEPKTGIGRDDNTNTASDSMLYRVGMRRGNDFEIIVDIQLPNEDFQYAATFIKLGGEGKIASFSDKGRMDSLRIEKDTIGLKPGEFKLYLATPAIFKNGWCPDLEGLGIKADLIAAAVGKPVHIGGFDMAERKPKPMYKAVPAGSVYYYRTKDSVELIQEKLQGEAISEFLKEQGFGISYIGNF